MTTKWIAKSALALVVTGACAIPACDSGKPEDIATSTEAATSGLVAGDIAITCYNSNNNPGDFLHIAPLRPIDNDTDLKLTDRETTAAGEFNNNDEVVNEVIPLKPADAGVGVIAAGTEIRVAPGTGLNNTTETVFIYQGTISFTMDGGVDGGPDAGALAGGRFLFGLQNSPGGGWATVRNDGLDLSERLTSLNGHDIAFNSNGAANMWFYTGPLTGTKAALQAALSTNSNWSSALAAAVNEATQCPGNLTVLPDGTDGGTDVATDVASGAGGAGGTAGAGAGGTAGAGAGGTAGTGAGAGGTAGTGAGGNAGTSGGTAGAGAGGSAGAGAGGSAGSGVTDAGRGDLLDSGSAGATGTGGATGAGGATDAGTTTDAKTDTGGTTVDAKADTGGTTVDAKADTGGTTVDAKADTGGTKVDSGTDAKAAGGGSSGCSCSTASTGAGLGTSAWMLALAGIVFTARRRRRR